MKGIKTNALSSFQ